MTKIFKSCKMSKEKEIYKEDKIVAENKGIGWSFLLCERKFLKSYIRKNKNNIYNYQSLKRLIRESSIDNFFKEIKCKMLKNK